MSNPSFSNDGQKIQLAVAVLGVVLTGINAWPAISSLQLLNIASIIFYILVLIAAFGVARLAVSRSATDQKSKKVGLEDKTETLEVSAMAPLKPSSDLLPEFAQAYDLEVCSLKVVLAKGHDWNSGGDSLRRLRVIYHDLVKEGESYRADVEFFSMADFVGGSLTKSQNEKGSDRFLIPVARSEHSSERYCVYSFLFTDESVRFDFVRLAHVNIHSGEIQLFICRGRGQRRRV